MKPRSPRPSRSSAAVKMKQSSPSRSKIVEQDRRFVPINTIVDTLPRFLTPMQINNCMHKRARVHRGYIRADANGQVSGRISQICEAILLSRANKYRCTSCARYHAHINITRVLCTPGIIALVLRVRDALIILARITCSEIRYYGMVLLLTIWNSICNFVILR